MPHFSKEPGFLREFLKLPAEQQLAFMAAVKTYIVKPMQEGRNPASSLFHKMSGFDTYEFRWDQSGRLRATCTLFTNAHGEQEIHWRRIGAHDDVYKRP